jgi:hypothetical protein
LRALLGKTLKPVLARCTALTFDLFKPISDAFEVGLEEIFCHSERGSGWGYLESRAGNKVEVRSEKDERKRRQQR